MRHWKLIAGAIVLVVVLGAGAAIMVLGSGLGESAAGDVHAGPGGPGAVQVAMTDNAFQPTAVDVASGAPAVIELQNTGQANHNFTSEALHVSTGPVKSGEVVTMTVSVPKGATRFVCTWHAGMAIDVTGT